MEFQKMEWIYMLAYMYSPCICLDIALNPAPVTDSSEKNCMYIMFDDETKVLGFPSGLC